MPVTFFILICLFCDSILLNAKPEQNAIAVIRIIKIAFFIGYKIILSNRRDKFSKISVGGDASR
jgi:hypothetical protein